MKRLQNKINNLIILLLLFFTVFHIFVISQVVSAEKIDLTILLNKGLKNSSELQELRREAARAERMLAEIKAQRNWQISINTDYSYHYRDGEFNSADGIGINTSISKIFIPGYRMSIEPVSNINPNIVLNDGKLRSDFNISLSKQILPSLPTELEQRYYKAEKDFLLAETNLRQKKYDYILSWVEDYLNLINLKRNIDIYQKSLKQAEANKDKVLKEKKIGEAGDTELMTAELSIAESKYRLQEKQNQFEMAQISLASELGLDKKEIEDLVISSLLINQREKVVELTSDFVQKNNLLEIVIDNSSELKANLTQRDILEKELEWLIKEDDLSLELVGDYNSLKEETSISFEISYKLYDGGQHNLKLEAKKSDIESNREQYEDIYTQLSQKLRQNLNNINLAEMNLKKGELSYKRNQNQLAIAKKQLQMGMIDYLEYQEEWINTAEAEVNIQFLQDQLFLSRLNFLQFVDYKLLAEIFEGAEI